MKKLKRIFWLGFSLLFSIFFAIIGVISFLTGKLFVGNENNGPSIISKSESPVFWLISTIITFGFVVFSLVWFFYQKNNKNWPENKE